MSLHVEPRVCSYWNKNPEKNFIHYQILFHIAKNRFEQIDRFFHISESQFQAETTQNLQQIFEKLEPLASVLRKRCAKVWKFGTHLIIDEAIARFTDKTKKIVNISKKPTLKDFKI